MKKYWIWYYGEFFGVLYWTESESEEREIERSGNAERITRRQAEHMCARERQKRKRIPMLAEYGATVIIPWSIAKDDLSWHLNNKVERVDTYHVVFKD